MTKHAPATPLPLSNAKKLWVAKHMRIYGVGLEKALKAWARMKQHNLI